MMCLSMACSDLNAQGYLVLKTSDTVRFENEIDVPSENRSEWTMVGIGKKIYLTDQIDCMTLKGDFFKVIHRKFYKRVIEGRISVYAMKDEDTLANLKGYVHHKIFVQGDQASVPKRISNYHLHQLMKDPINIGVRKRSRYSVAAVPLLIYGAPGTVTGVVLLGAAAVSSHFNTWNDPAEILVTMGLSALVQTSIYSVPGAIFYLSGRRVSLREVHHYNSL